jgi:hypothetical protein
MKELKQLKAELPASRSCTSKCNLFYAHLSRQQIFCWAWYFLQKTVTQCILTLSWPAGHICPTYKESFFKSAGITVSHIFSMLPSTLKYLCSVKPVRTHLPAKQLLCSIAHSIICMRPFRGKMRSDWFNGTEILQGRWQHGENVGYCYPSGHEKTLCKWDI